MLSGDLVEPVIRRSVEIKAEIVSADEFETGNERVLLNYGHTIGHAIEAVTEYGSYLHGEAVSIGMMVAAGISHRMGFISEELVDRQRNLLNRFELPVTLSGVDADTLIEATTSDKKSRGGKIRWVLLRGPGRSTTSSEVSTKIVRAALADVMSPVPPSKGQSELGYLTARDRGDDTHLIAVVERSRNPVDVPNVLAVDVDVHEVAKLPIVVAKTRLDPRKRPIQRLDHRRNVTAFSANRRLLVRQPSQRCRYLD